MEGCVCKEMRITRHSKERIVQRDVAVESFAQAKRVAKQAYTAGKTIGHYQSCPKFHEYLRGKKAQTCNCSIRVYRGNIYIWRGKNRTLVTAHLIPDRFNNELEAMENK